MDEGHAAVALGEPADTAPSLLPATVPALFPAAGEEGWWTERESDDDMTVTHMIDELTRGVYGAELDALMKVLFYNSLAHSEEIGAMSADELRRTLLTPIKD